MGETIGAGVRASFVTTSDLRVRYLHAGTGANGAPPVVFVHGFPQTSYQWRHQLAALAEAGFACFAPDVRGFGGTDKPGVRMSRELLAADVVRFCDALGLEAVTLVGHDWGGIIAFKAAIDHPDRFTRLALLDTLCTVWSIQAVHGYWFKAEGLAEAFFAEHHAAFIEVLFGGRDAAVLGSRPANPWPIPPGARPRPSWIDHDALAHYVGAFRDPEAWAHAISAYRYALPFHRVVADPAQAHGERFVALSESEVAAMWLHPGGLEAHPLHPEHLDFAPHDRHRRYPHPALWLSGSYLGRRVGGVFGEQFPRLLPRLTHHALDAGHFLGEEAPAEVNAHVMAFCRPG